MPRKHAHFHTLSSGCTAIKQQVDAAFEAWEADDQDELSRLAEEIKQDAKALALQAESFAADVATLSIR